MNMNHRFNNAFNKLAVGATAAGMLALAGCATSGYGSAGTGYGNGYGTSGSAYGSTSAECYDCGVITSIQPITTQGRAPNATGAVLGGLVGAAAGRELADDKSEGRQNTATAVGAVAGALAGNAIQNRTQANDGTYRVTVRLDDGRTTVVTQSDLGGIREGSYVKLYDGRAWAR